MKYRLSRVGPLALALAFFPMTGFTSTGTFDLPEPEQSSARQPYVVKLHAAEDLDAALAAAHVADRKSRLIRRSKIMPRYFWIELSTQAAEALRTHPAVSSVTADAASTRLIDTAKAAVPISARSLSSKTAPPLSGNPTAGSDVRVAILSTGVDYTHALLSGAGTAEAYEEALANADTAWSGFPTGVVTHGLDVNTDFGGVDPNPIEPVLTIDDPVEARWLPSGRGTFLASVVHQLAPGAKLMAYKVWTFRRDEDGRLLVGIPTQEVYERAFTHLLDPNGDGDRSDRADIVLLDARGGLAFHDPYGDDASGDSILIDFAQAVAAQGVLVVSSSGELLGNSRYSIAQFGAAPDALTVGALKETDSGFATTGFSAQGPVRGITGSIKPDLVSYGVNVPGALFGSGDGTVELTGTDVAAARIAAAAAILKAERPQLSATDLKALLANTSKHDVLLADSETLAEVPAVGLGREDVDAAIAATAVIRDESTHQPSMNFGFHETATPLSLVRKLVVRNVTDEDRTFAASHEVLGDKTSNAAITLEYPANVYVPAQRQVVIPVVLHVDPAALAPWPIRGTEDYSSENWSEVQINGYLTFSDGGQDLSIAWMVTPRARTVIAKHFETKKELFESPLSEGFADFVTGYSQEFSNTGPAAEEFVAIPLMAERKELPEHRENAHGHMLRYAGAGVFDEAACTSGRKLMIAVSMRQPAEVAEANFFDKIGTPLFHFKIFPQSTVVNYGLDVETNDNIIAAIGDSEWITFGFVELDENGRPVTVTTDLNSEFDPENPAARYRISKLPVYMPTHARTAIAQMCVEELFHHEFQDESGLDENLGFVIATDRDTFPAFNAPIVQFNPVRYGREKESCGFFGCSAVNTGTKVTLERAPGSEADTAFHYRLELAPGEIAKLTAIKDSPCDGFSLTPVACDRSFLLLGLNSDFVLKAQTTLEGQDVYVAEQQRLSVSENAEAGQTVGKLALEADGFFGIAEQPDYEWTRFLVQQINVLPDNPFVVHPDGEVTVANAGALDHETYKQYVLRVNTVQNEYVARATDVFIDVANVNDVAPVYLGGLDDQTMVGGEALNIHLPAHFTDEEGDALTFAVDGLPRGVVFNAVNGTITGIPEDGGTSAVHVTASDGVHETKADFKIRSGSGGGGGGSLGLWLLLALLPAFRVTRLFSRE